MPGMWNDVPDITAMDTIQICGVVKVTPPRLIIRRKPGAIQIGWTTRTNKLYQLEYRTSLASTNSWTAFGAPIAGDGSTNWMVDSDSSQRESYYRVGELP